MKEVSDILFRIRSALGVKTDKKMCEILKIPYGTLDNWKNRKKIPKDRLLDIALSLNLSFEYLLFGDTKQNNNVASSEQSGILKPTPNRVDFESIGDRLEVMRKIVNMNKEKTYIFLQTTKHRYHQVRWGRMRFPLEWAYKFRDTYGFRLDWIYSGKGEIFERQD